MNKNELTLEAFETAIDSRWQEAYQTLLAVLLENIPSGFELKMQYGYPTFVVPLEMFPEGYLNRSDEPLPFISVGVTKRQLAVYHMGIMGNKALDQWFQQEYQKRVPTKLNKGKSCIRFTNPKKIPYELLGELAGKMSVSEWIEQYQMYQKKKAK